MYGLRRLRPLGLAAAALVFSACSGGTIGLFESEVDFLREDVIDLITIVFQAGENALVGDPVAPEDILDPPDAANGWTVTYALPFGFRVGLRDGSGEARLRILEDGVPVETPLQFTFDATDALLVEIDYELVYQGETRAGRETSVDLTITITATRAVPGDAFMFEYFVEGQVDLGRTLTDIHTRFLSPGRPRDGIVKDFGDGEGTIDDPDVVDIFFYDIDWAGEDRFRVEGDVGFCCFFDEIFFYESVL